jgi:SAM-dependent methyltransferase
VSPDVFAAFDALCARYCEGGHALEIGAMPAKDTLLNLPALRSFESRTGINPTNPGAVDGGEILQGHGSDLGRFTDGQFDLVLSNSTLEHDPAFWLTLAESQRVLKAGGLLLLGVPGYARQRSLVRRAAGLAATWTRRMPPIARRFASLAAGSATLVVHDYPGDYYRFSEQALCEVLLGGTDVLEMMTVGAPPRFVGIGRKPRDGAAA